DGDGFVERPAFIGHAVDAPVFAVAVRVADVVLHVADDRVLPVDEINRTVGTDLQVRRAEIRICRGDDGFQLLADETHDAVLPLVPQNPLKSNHIADEQIAPKFFWEVFARDVLHPRTGAR